MRNRPINFAVDLQTGLVYSRVGTEVAVPYPKHGKGLRMAGTFEMNYELQRFPLYSIQHKWGQLHFSQNIPLRIQNYHRQFWRLPEIHTPRDRVSESTANLDIPLRK